jgi:UDP-N-acetylmuramate: L-alanyl-gamma-D-glutamyl-meso-diaminopimelate ligase
MRIHILGICGSFMGGLALLARQVGHEVSGSDSHVYPPMSTLLRQSGIDIHEGYDPGPLSAGPDMVIIGNVLSRGNEAIEYVLDQGLAYTSGPQWLSDNILRGRHVIAISGTHGKTSSTSMLAWVLECAGKSPGFLIGGVAENFGVSARMGSSEYFVVEADEYDTAFFDKRAKFVHYRPRTLVITNIEYDHADIFGDIGDIIREFRRLIRTVPRSGRIVIKADDPNIQRVLQGGCWTPTIGFAEKTADWQYTSAHPDFSGFDLIHADKTVCSIHWELIGRHNVENALAVTAAACQLGIDPGQVATALGSYKSVKRRLEKLAVINGITIYDDFAHHPTAISTTLSAMRENVGQARIIAVFEPRSNTMKMGIHQHTLAQAFKCADEVWAYQPHSLSWDLGNALQGLADRYHGFVDIESIVDPLVKVLQSGDHVVIMSNGSFGGIHEKLVRQLKLSQSRE